MQLVAYGAQDIYLTGNPQITFFKVVYRRHTNFSMESIKQTWNGNSTTNGTCSATISRNGDLVHRMYIEVFGSNSIPISNEGTRYYNPGSSSITTVELEIGGQRVDKHTGKWMEVWSELTEPNPTGSMSGPDHENDTDDDWNKNSLKNGTLFQNMSGMGGVILDLSGDKSPGHAEVARAMNKRHFIPLQFWFCRNPGLALPLIALQYHEVKVILDHTYATGYSNGTDPIETNDLWCDYIYLDTDERRRFAQVSHEYLIEQVQEQAWTRSNNELNFNHPVKELIWCGADIAQAPGLLAYPLNDNWKLTLNGHERFAARHSTYFTRTQVWEHHSGAGGLRGQWPPRKGGNGSFNDSIAVYSFALKPEEHQPSGTCNFSRIDNAELVSEYDDSGVIVFAVNYNVLRIMSGMGGLAYSN